MESAMTDVPTRRNSTTSSYAKSNRFVPDNELANLISNASVALNDVIRYDYQHNGTCNYFADIRNDSSL